MYSLIHSVDDFRIFPSRLEIYPDIPARIHNISLVADHRVSLKPYEVPKNINVKPKEISLFEFTPEVAGVYTIQHEIHGFIGTLVVVPGPGEGGGN